MAIVVVGCDLYSDIADYYIMFLKKNWPDCRFPVYVATESHEFTDKSINSVICGSNSTWTGRAIKAIKQANTKYILLTVDDIFISEAVDSSAFEEILQFMNREKIMYYRIPVFRTSKKYEKSYPGFDNVELIAARKPYAISIGTAIWNCNELLRVLGDGSKSAWELENDFSCFSINYSKPYIDKYVADKRFLLHSVHMIKAGKWIPKAAREMKKKGLKIDYSKRGFIPKRQLIRSSVYGIGTKICPPKYRGRVKAVLSRIGFKFATKY